MSDHIMGTRSGLHAGRPEYAADISMHDRLHTTIDFGSLSTASHDTPDGAKMWHDAYDDDHHVAFGEIIREPDDEVQQAGASSSSVLPSECDENFDPFSEGTEELTKRRSIRNRKNQIRARNDDFRECIKAGMKEGVFRLGRKMYPAVGKIKPMVVLNAVSDSGDFMRRLAESYLRNDKNVDPTEVEKQLEWVENKILHRKVGDAESQTFITRNCRGKEKDLVSSKIKTALERACVVPEEFDFVRDSKATTGKAALYNPAHIWSSGSWKVPAEWEKDWPAAADKASFNAGKRPMKTKRPDALSSPLSKAVYPKKKAKQSSGELAPDRKISKN